MISINAKLHFIQYENLHLIKQGLNPRKAEDKHSLLSRIFGFLQ